jgi:hypothetical protein
MFWEKKELSIYFYIFTHNSVLITILHFPVFSFLHFSFYISLPSLWQKRPITLPSLWQKRPITRGGSSFSPAKSPTKN